MVRSAKDGENIASIDIGSFTARLLVARKMNPPGLFHPFDRRRSYIRLAEGFDDHKRKTICPSAIERALNVLKEFSLSAKEYGVEDIQAVSTGVVRRAVNQDDFLRLIREKTGIIARVISGEEEADLTMRGVNHALHLKSDSSLIFDLGGGTTEFISGLKGNIELRSLPLGAMLLQERFLVSDPPDADQIKGLLEYIDRKLEEALFHDHCIPENTRLVGSGGTVTTLAAMMKRMETRDITPEKLNGSILIRNRIERLFEYMKSVPGSERLRLPGLDEDRAKVILAGTSVIVRILEYLKLWELTVCCSDILEGILISYLEGDKNE